QRRAGTRDPAAKPEGAASGEAGAGEPGEESADGDAPAAKPRTRQPSRQNRPPQQRTSRPRPRGTQGGRRPAAAAGEAPVPERHAADEALPPDGAALAAGEDASSAAGEAAEGNGSVADPTKPK